MKFNSIICKVNVFKEKKRINSSIFFLCLGATTAKTCLCTSDLNAIKYYARTVPENMVTKKGS